MQKSLLRNLFARNQAVKAAHRESKKLVREDKRKIRLSRFSNARVERAYIKAERAHRREDWTLGPLAPNRSIGRDGNGYGMLRMEALQPPEVLKAEREKYFNFAVKDRVVVVKGRERGKIGEVRVVDIERQTVQLADVNMADVKITPFMREETNTLLPYQSFPLPIRIQDVRLVVPLQDAVTGTVKDTVIEHLRGGRPFIEPPHGSNTPKHTRYINGPDEIEIPWPKDKIPEFKTEAVDTLRMHVDDRSFLPSIYNVPLPESAVGEIRTKDSKIKQVQSQEYVQKQMRVDAKRHWKRGGRMVSPQQEFWEYKAKQEQAQGKPEVSAETSELIREMQATGLAEQSTSLAGQKPGPLG